MTSLRSRTITYTQPCVYLRVAVIRGLLVCPVQQRERHKLTETTLRRDVCSNRPHLATLAVLLAMQPDDRSADDTAHICC